MQMHLVCKHLGHSWHACCRSGKQRAAAVLLPRG